MVVYYKYLLLCLVRDVYCKIITGIVEGTKHSPSLPWRRGVPITCPAVVSVIVHREARNVWQRKSDEQVVSGQWSKARKRKNQAPFDAHGVIPCAQQQLLPYPAVKETQTPIIPQSQAVSKPSTPFCVHQLLLELHNQPPQLGLLASYLLRDTHSCYNGGQGQRCHCISGSGRRNPHFSQPAQPRAQEFP